MKLTTVLLDAGGVILDESECEQVCADLIVTALRRAVPGYSLERYWSDVNEAVERYCPSTRRYVFWKNVRQNPHEFGRLWDRFLGDWREQAPPPRLMPGIGKEITALAGPFSLVLAGQYGREVMDLLEKHSLTACFKSRLTQDDYHITKPDPRYFELIVAQAGAMPRECVMVGDRIDNDVVPARQLGMKSVFVRTGIYRDQRPRLPEETPDVSLESVIGLYDAVVDLSEGT